jgi:hypothetical protein
MASKIMTGRGTDDLADDEVKRLCWTAWRLWETVEPHIDADGPSVEAALEFERDGVRLTGHPDVRAGMLDGRRLIVDFKFGYLDLDFEPQLRAYAWLDMQTNDADETYACIIKARSSELIPYSFTLAELDRWFARLADRLKRQDEYTPGQHCRFCPRSHECPGRAAELRHAGTVLGVVDIDDSRLADAVEKALALKRLCDAFVEHAKVEASVRPIPGLEVVDRSQRKIVLPEAAPVLMARLGEDVSKVLDVGVGRLEKELRLKGHKVADVMRELEQAGAIERETHKRLELRSASEALTTT